MPRPSAQRSPPAPASNEDSPNAAFPTETPATADRLRALVKVLRPHQWTKNLLVFVPALLAHATERDVWIRAAWAFAAFCLCASSAYVVNDLVDLDADRAHATKSRRPFASGTLPPRLGLLIAPLLLAAGFALALALPPGFAAVLGIYYLGTLGYSLLLKRLVLVDVLMLAGLYTVRLIAGGAAYQVPLSQWLLAFALFLFLSLAFVKRYSEVQAVRREGASETKGRGYRAGDLEQLAAFGSAAGYLSVLVLALWAHSEDVRRLYQHPARLWIMLPLLLYWISRVWLLAHRGQLHEDPIVFAIRDWPSYLVALGAAATMLVAL